MVFCYSHGFGNIPLRPTYDMLGGAFGIDHVLYVDETIMKAFSIVRPAGTQIANGLKTLEIRKWFPDIRSGENILLIENQNFLMEEEQSEMGKAVAIITLGDIR